MQAPRLLAAILVAFAIAGIANAQHARRKPADPTQPPVINDETQLLWTQYEKAVYDSTVYIRWNLRKLRPLTVDADGMVTVATITHEESRPGHWFTTGGSGTWVTGVPEVRNICSQWSGTPAEIETRLRQLIGLPPDADTQRFLVFRVPAAIVFRPAVNPAIDTEYPCKVDETGVPPADCGNAFPAHVSPAHYQWMAQSAFDLHAVPDGYPWTHIGYTYNWRPGEDRYGTSEYVIQGNTKVCVTEVIDPSWKYCLPDWKPAKPADSTSSQHSDSSRMIGAAILLESSAI